MNKINIPQQQPIIPGQKIANRASQQHPAVKTGNYPSFAEVLHKKASEISEGIKFSAHAQKRLADRNISIDALEMAKLETALTKAQAKGAKESLVLIDNRAYVISVPNKVVITAVDEGSLKENLFTNIDSAIIM